MGWDPAPDTDWAERWTALLVAILIIVIALYATGVIPHS